MHMILKVCDKICGVVKTLRAGQKSKNLLITACSILCYVYSFRGARNGNGLVTQRRLFLG